LSFACAPPVSGVAPSDARFCCRRSGAMPVEHASIGPRAPISERVGPSRSRAPP
jgi:hypothetical protein